MHVLVDSTCYPMGVHITIMATHVSDVISGLSLSMLYDFGASRTNVILPWFSNDKELLSTTETRRLLVDVIAELPL